MSQTSVKNNQDFVPFAGALAGVGPHQIGSYVSEEGSDEIPLGCVVLQGSADAGAVLGATGTPVGITAHSHHYSKNPNNLELGTTGLTPGTTMNVLQAGIVYVKLCESGMTTASAVRFVHTADTGQPVGTVRKTANANNTTLLSAANCKLLDSGGDGDIVRLWVNMLGATVTADT